MRGRRGVVCAGLAVLALLAAGGASATVFGRSSASTTAPPPTLASPAAGATFTTTTIDVSGGGLPGAYVAVYEGSTRLATGPVDPTGVFSLHVALDYGMHTLTATQRTDVLSESDPSNAVQVKIAPQAPSISAPSRSTDPNILVSGVGVAGATVTVLDGASAVKTALVDDSGTFIAALNLDYGPHTLTATQTKNEVTSPPSTPVSADITPPPPVIDSPPASSLTTAASVVLRGFGAAGLGLEIDVDGSPAASVAVAPDNTWSATVPLAVGAHTIVARQARNGEASDVSNAVVVHRLPLPPSVVAPADGSSAVELVAVSGTGEPGASVTVVEDGAVVATIAVAADGSFAGTAVLPPGFHTLTFRQALNGETSASTDSRTVRMVPAAPLVTSPANGDTLTSPVGFAGSGLPGATITVDGDRGRSTAVTASGSGAFSGALALPLGPVTLTFTQTLNGQTSAPATRTLTVVRGNQAPVANAGSDLTAREGDRTKLDGSGSTDADHDALAYRWTQVGGPAVVLDKPTDAKPAFTAPDGPATLTFRLVVNDGRVDSAADDVVVQVANVAPTVTGAPNRAGVPEASVQTYALGTLADASSADAPWAVTVDWGDGSAAAVLAATALGPLGAAPHTYADNGTYTVVVGATDKDGARATESFVVNVVNVAPSAGAGGPYTGSLGSPVVLAGTGSDPAGARDPLSFAWDFDYSGGTFTVDASGATASHAYSLPGTYTAALRVSDDDGGATIATTTVTIAAPASTEGMVEAELKLPGGFRAKVNVHGKRNGRLQGQVRFEAAGWRWESSALSALTVSGSDATVTGWFGATAFRVDVHDGGSGRGDRDDDRGRNDTFRLQAPGFDSGVLRPLAGNVKVKPKDD